MAQQLGVADLLVRCLEREGVTAIFGIPGEENIYFADALAYSHQMQLGERNIVGEATPRASWGPAPG